MFETKAPLRLHHYVLSNKSFKMEKILYIFIIFVYFKVVVKEFVYRFTSFEFLKLQDFNLQIKL